MLLEECAGKAFRLRSGVRAARGTREPGLQRSLVRPRAPCQGIPRQGWEIPLRAAGDNPDSSSPSPPADNLLTFSDIGMDARPAVPAAPCLPRSGLPEGFFFFPARDSLAVRKALLAPAASNTVEGQAVSELKPGSSAGERGRFAAYNSSRFRVGLSTLGE
jgi:hypothetical protein